MKQNQNILSAIRKWWIVLLLFVVFQILLFVVANAMLGEFAVGFELSPAEVAQWKIVVTAVVVLIAVIQNVALLNRIFRTKDLLNVQPVKCIIEDFIITSYRRDGKVAYNVYLLLKDPVNGRLYFTYGSHSLSFYSYIVSKSGRSLVDVQVFRKDKSAVCLEDDVLLYIRKPIKVAVRIEDDCIKLNGKKFAYQHIKENVSHQTFKTVNFVEGAVDVNEIHAQM